MSLFTPKARLHVTTDDSQEQAALSPEERARLRKNMSDQAIKMAVASRWDEAVSVNREYIRAIGEEPEALNRLGKALSEVGRVTEARSSYSRALELDPANTIARRMLDKLSNMSDSAAAVAAGSQVDTRLFIEETGKATVASLTGVDPDRKIEVDAGDLVELKVEGNAVNVVSREGEYIGMVEPRSGLRLSRMMTAGNQYSAAVVSVSPHIRVMIREIYQHPSMVGRVSFPQAKATDFRGYTRRGLIARDDADWTDEDDDDTETEDWSELDSDLESDGTTVDIQVEQDDESFD